MAAKLSDSDILLNGIVMDNEKHCLGSLLCLYPDMQFWSKDALLRWFMLSLDVTMDFAALRGNKRKITDLKKKMKKVKKEVMLKGVSRERILQIIYEETLTCEGLNLNIRSY